MATSLKEKFLELQPSKDKREYMLEYAHEEIKNLMENNIRWTMDEYISVPIPDLFYEKHYKFISEDLKKFNNKRSITLQEAATTDYDNYAYLVPEVIAERIYEAAFPHLVARQLLDLVTFKGTTYTLQKGTKDSVKAFIINEGAEIPEQLERYTEETVKPEKYGVRVELTTEMIEDARVALFPRNVRLAGEAMAKLENTRIQNTIINSGTDYSGSAPITLVQILNMMTEINANDWDADTIVMHPYQMRELMKTDEWRSEAGRFQANSRFVEDALRGQVMRLWGVLDILVSSEMTAGTIIIMDRKIAGIIAQNRAITAKRYDDVQRDATGYLATQRLKAKIIWSDAVQVCDDFNSS
ncbi:MAG: phage major capsid protein [Chlamydiae bacterium]|nr:MAG: phage major capsid protein [Chlamydiota bacterium]